MRTSERLPRELTIIVVQSTTYNTAFLANTYSRYPAIEPTILGQR